MAEKKYYWLKLQDDFFTSKRIKKLRGLAGGDTFTIIYLKMQLVAMKKGGVIEYTGLEPTFAEELALDIDEKPENVAVTVSYLLSCGLLEESSDGTEYFVPYAVMNTGSESSSTRRVREHRERKSLQCNADVTPMKQICNTEIEKEIEKEKDTEIEKKADEPPLSPPSLPVETKKGNKKSKHEQPPADYTGTGFSQQLIDTVEKWLKYKAERKDIYAPTGLQSLITQIKNNVNKYGEAAVIEVIGQSMSNLYKGIIFEKLEKAAKNQPYQGGGYRNARPAGVDRILEMMNRGDFDE